VKNSPLNLFIVDDDESVRRSLSRLMRAAGFSSRAFSSAREFLDEVSPGTEGILILDMSMPGMNGLELQQKLIENESPIPVIFISAIENTREKECAMEAGALGFLHKPFLEQELLALIEAAAAQ
jgi:FixJ family two-component response regulator